MTYKNRMNGKLKYIFIISILVSIIIMPGCGSDPFIKDSTILEYDVASLETIPNNPYFDLKVPTYITKIDNLYFIVDCYNNQVIYNENLEEPLCYWSVMTSDINMGHTIASDGTVYLIDDTENNRILVMEKRKNSSETDVFVPTQEFSQIGTRPHFILYDENTETFYAWSSMTGEMFLFKRKTEDNRVFLSEIRKIEELDGFYVRSFSIIDDMVYFVSGNGNIIVADMDDFSIKQRYAVPDELFGMVQVTKIDDYFYVTVSTDILCNQEAATIIRTKDLSALALGDYEDVYEHFIGGGTPYCITSFDDHFYLCEHRIPGHSIWQFDVKNSSIQNETTIY